MFHLLMLYLSCVPGLSFELGEKTTKSRLRKEWYLEKTPGATVMLSMYMYPLPRLKAG